MTTRQKVTIGAFALIIFQLSLRIWAVWSSWFYGDDFKFLSQASTEPLTLDFLFARHQQQLMPGGILIAWLVGQGPAFSWPLAAAVIVVMQAMASVACFVMLARVFGRRPGILIPLALYLFSPLTLGAFMWWAASLNQIPLQIVFFLIIASHVEYLRTRKLRWVAASWFLLLIGLIFYIKAVVMIPVLALVTFAYFANGSVPARIRSVLRSYWPAWTGFAIVLAIYLAAYMRTGESPVQRKRNSAYFETADRQIRETLGPALVGGPWRWLDPGRQDVLSHAPDFSISIAWIVIAAIVGLTIHNNQWAWKAWAILVAYLVPTVFLTANGRAWQFGPDVGLYVRYLSDVSVVVCLALACATMSIVGCSEPLRKRPNAVRVPPGWIAAGCLMFLIGSVWSTVDYATFWHKESPAETFVRTVSRELRPVDRFEIIDEPVPEYFVLALNTPFDRPSRLLAPLGKRIDTVTGGTDLKKFSPSGRLARAFVLPGIRSLPAGNTDCGFLIKSNRPQDIALEHSVSDETWWMSVHYLASKSGLVTVKAGSNTRSFWLEEGPHTLLYRTIGAYDSVTIESDSQDLATCVVDITVGLVDTLS